MPIDPKIFQALKIPCPIPDLGLPAGLRLLVMAPHPDDFDAIGVTLRFFHLRGSRIDVAVARTGSGVEDCYRPGLDLAGKADLRQIEQKRSLAFFGLPEDRTAFLSLDSDGQDQICDSPRNRDFLDALVRSRNPDILLMPHWNDSNSGHRAMYSLMDGIVSGQGRGCAFFLNRDPKTVGMRIDAHMPFGRDEAQWKAELLRFHDSQHQRNIRSRGRGFDDRILDTNRLIAKELAIGSEYAEAFEIEVREEGARP